MAEQKTCGVCGKPSTLRCPKCVSLGLPDSFFCSQACFKTQWPTHKLIHEVAAAGGLSASTLAAVAAAAAPKYHDPRFVGYEFTGEVRPHPLSPRRAVPAEIPRPDYADSPTGEPRSEMQLRGNNAVEVKTPEQIAGMREACRVAREVIDCAAKAIKPGVTTDEIDRVVHEATISRGAYPSPLNYRCFPKSVCTSVNEVICHGIPDARPLREGDIVNVDVTCFYKGYHGDLNETYPVGEIDEASKLLIQATYESLRAAIAVCKPGVRYREIGDVISKSVRPHSLSVVNSYCGHGIGRLFHTAPNVPHYAKNKAVGFMRAGHTFTIEPMINAGSYHDELWPDEWTAVTRDGKRSAQFEHTLLITDTGVEVLTERTANSYHYWFLGPENK
eukprot:TRINITY_DN17987_c0_g1_i1.p1 TRINITY_DN17987_c0_g1~~TRINITY_DN17987_c0_g1_i1.p1  ORF type:complete len:407 (+),score=93.90 TRINITY_DN17987_c0_g1_i1:58-1221(+)